MTLAISFKRLSIRKERLLFILAVPNRLIGDPYAEGDKEMVIYYEVRLDGSHQHERF